MLFPESIPLDSASSRPALRLFYMQRLFVDTPETGISVEKLGTL